MSNDSVLLMTDVVDSTLLSEQLGEDRAAALWAAHDHLSRDLFRLWHGREIDKSDGFLLLFDRVGDALGCALALHQALASLDPPLAARAGIHCGVLRLRPNRDEDIRQGAKPIEVDGLAKPMAARIMGLTRGGQTLLSDSARAALGSQQDVQVSSHGHWRLKGLPDPVELFEAGHDGSHFAPPEASPKAYRVIPVDGQWLALQAVPNNLPAERDGFVGRGEALATLARRFDDGARLVSLLGIGGIGKTRMALRYARGWLGDHAGGAWFCDLSAARGPDGIVQATAQGLGLLLGPVDPVEKIGQAIAGRGACLVIFDNFEQVARHAEATLGRWLAAAPQARFLVTSREVLGIAGEQTLSLAPLGDDEAARLFDQRARAADSGYQPSATDRAAVAPLMDLLDRLPLAIELAAARVRVMPPGAMLNRMDRRFRLLAAHKGRHDRQATMRATLDWSWDLLSSAEQAALAQLSVFEGSFALDSAEAVIDLSALEQAPWAADAVQGLVEKSLLRRRSDGRLGLLRTVQDYAAEKLANAGAAAAAECRHWRHFAAFNEGQATAARCAELDNLVIACRRATAAVEPGHAVGALMGAWAALRLTGPFRAVVELVRSLEGIGELQPSDQMRVHWVMTGAMHHLGDPDGAEHRLQQGLALSEGFPHLVAERARLLGWRAELQRLRGQYDAVGATLDEAQALAASCGDAHIRLRLMNTAGSLALAQGRLDAATAAFGEVLVIARQLGDQRWEGGAQGNLGIVRHEQGRRPEALDHYRQAVALAQLVGDRPFEGNARCNLGLLLHEMGDTNAAHAELLAATHVAEAIDHRRLAHTVRCNLAIVNEALGRTDAALDDYRLAIAQAASLSDRHSEGQFRGYLALLLARQGRAAEASGCFDEAATLLSLADDPGSEALLDAQRAVAARLAGDTAGADSLIVQAETLAGRLGLGSDSEVLRLLAEAGALGTPAARPSPDEG